MKKNLFSLTSLEVGLPQLISNVYIFEYKDKINLVDAGYGDISGLINTIQNNYGRVDNIFITHGHFDHIDGLGKLLEAFPKAIVHIHEDEVDFLEDSSLSLSRRFRMFEGFRNNIRAFKGGIYIDGLLAINTPGHTIGGSCFYLEEYGVCFTGDTLFSDNHGRTDLPTGSYDSMRISIAKLLQLDPQTVIYPGHGEYGVKLSDVRNSDSETMKYIFSITE